MTPDLRTDSKELGIAAPTEEVRTPEELPAQDPDAVERGRLEDLEFQDPKPTRKKKLFYSPGEKAKISRLYLVDGLSSTEIARRYDVKPSAMRMALARWGISRAEDPTAASKVASSGQATRRGSQRLKVDTDIATRLSVLLGLEVRPTAPRREISDEALMLYAGERSSLGEATALWERVRPHILREPVPGPNHEAMSRLGGFLAFAHDLIDVEPQDYQIAIAYTLLAHRSAVFTLGRQTGKDWTAALFAAWESITRPNSRTLVVSEAQRQSDQLAERAMAFIARSVEAFDTISDSNRERLSFRNGSAIYFLPSTGAIRGLTEITRAILNEARGIPDETYEAVQPMLARLNGSLSLFSTPMGRQGKLYEYFTAPTFAAMQLPSSVNKYLSPQFLEDEKLKLDADAYSREYLGQFSDVAGAFFSTYLIDRARQEYPMVEVREASKIYAIGYDPARVRDSSVVTVVSKERETGVLRVEAIHDFVNVDFQTQLAVIKRLAEVFRPWRVVVEYGGLGMGPAEELQRAGLPVVKFVPTVASKLEAYGSLKNLLERGLLTIPASHRKLQTELRMFQFQVTDSGNILLKNFEGGGDDFADSLCFACFPFRGRPSAGVVFVDPRLFSSPIQAIADAMSPADEVRRDVPPNPKDLIKDIRVFPSPGECLFCGLPIGPNQAFRDSTTLRGLLHSSCPAVGWVLPGGRETTWQRRDRLRKEAHEKRLRGEL